jgi:hypothetical protein
MAQHSYLQPWEPLAAGAAGRDRRLVADQHAAEAGKDWWWATRKACPVLLADADGRTPDARAVCGEAAADRVLQNQLPAVKFRRIRAEKWVLRENL